MHRAFLSAAFASCLLLSSCATWHTRPVAFENHPVAMRGVSTVIDEEKIEYTVKFRNTGREVLSFDYTLADQPDVPHIDSEGPNSGLIENLYPGAEIEVPNPLQRRTVFATLGTVTYGKKPKDELTRIYKQAGPAPAGAAAMDGLLPPVTPGT